VNVLFVTTRNYLPQCVGGSEWSTHFLCRGLESAGDKVGLLCHLQNSGWLALENRLKRKLTGKKFPADRRMGYRVFRGWGSANGLSEAVHDLAADAIVVIGAAPNPAQLARAALKTGLPVLYQLRDVEFDKHGDGLGNLSGIRFISNSAFTANKFQREFGKASDIILPPVLASHCKVERPGSKVLLINPAPPKGGEIAMAMAEQRPHIPFIFQESWASNSQLNELKRRAKEAGNVEWRTQVMDIRTAYADARILLAPSQWEEAWGRVATEAHISGIPVIASDCGGLSQSVGPGGLLLRPDAPLEDWLKALDRLWDDKIEWQRLSTCALEYSVRKETDPEHQIASFRKIILDTIRQHAQRPNMTQVCDS